MIGKFLKVTQLQSHCTRIKTCVFGSRDGSLQFSTLLSNPISEWYKTQPFIICCNWEASQYTTLFLISLLGNVDSSANSGSFKMNTIEFEINTTTQYFVVFMTLFSWCPSHFLPSCDNKKFSPKIIKCPVKGCKNHPQLRTAEWSHVRLNS